MNFYLTWAIVMAIGTWIAQDAIASILHYLKSDENWYFNHALRLARLVCGLALIVLSCIELIGK